MRVLQVIQSLRWINFYTEQYDFSRCFLTFGSDAINFRENGGNDVEVRLVEVGPPLRSAENRFRLSCKFLYKQVSNL